MAGVGASSQMGIETPDVFTWAIKQADTYSWQAASHAPFSQAGASPICPWKVYALP